MSALTRTRTLRIRLRHSLIVLATGAALATAGLVALPAPARAASGPLPYLADYRNNVIDVIDAAGYAGVATIPVGQQSRGRCAQPGWHSGIRPQ